MIVDAHAHACGEYVTADAIKQKLRSCGCDKVILTPGQNGSRTTYALKNKAQMHPYEDVVTKQNRSNKMMMGLLGMIRTVPKGNECVYELVKQYPESVYQNYWVTKKNVDKLDEDYKRMQFVAVKLHQCWENFSVGDAYFEKVTSWATKQNLPLFIHMYSHEEVEKMVQYKKSHPQLKLIMGHLYGAELFTKEAQTACENVYFDLSNCYFVSKERFLLAYQALGAEHFLLGSDTPYGRQALEKTMEQIKTSGIPEEDIQKICGENAVKLFAL